MNTNKFILVAVAILFSILVIGSAIRLRQAPSTPAKPAENVNTVTFVCDDGKSITASFYPGNDTKVSLQLSDGRQLSLPHAISADGARYANADESFVFWNRGDTAFITEGSLTSFANCALPSHPAPDDASTPYQNSSFLIDGQSVQLVDGFSKVGSTTTRYFGNQVNADLNQDGKSDAAFIVTQDGGGSGTFYYVVAALKTNTGYVGTNGILLGDRIAPQTTEFKSGKIIVNFATRKPNEPMTATPSVNVSKYFKVSSGKLVAMTK